ncbi:MAG: DUF2752 domain-containing protein [Lachnospiraceae bacterium]|nr:DUF2752 domain-containing protein [Lachnospiraceae bacterium]
MKRFSTPSKQTLERYLCILLIAVVLLFYKCPFRLFLGISCPGCGMSRAFLALLRLDFQSAFYYHPLFPLVILLAVWGLLEYFHILHVKKTMRRILLILTCALFLLVYLIRLCSGSDVVQFCPEDSLLFFYLPHRL